jgi:hypothetical protein
MVRVCPANDEEKIDSEESLKVLKLLNHFLKKSVHFVLEILINLKAHSKFLFMSQLNCGDPSAFERTQFIQVATTDLPVLP